MTEEFGLISKLMDEHLNNDDKIIDQEYVMVNLQKDHTIIPAAYYNKNLFQMERKFEIKQL